MKRNILLIALFGVSVAFAAPRVYAETVVNYQDIPINAITGNPCTHNMDTVSGTAHEHSSVTLSASGLHVDSFYHTSDFKLLDPTVGQCSGSASVSSTSFNTTTSALPVTFTAHTKVQFQCPGPANNYSLDLQIHTTINPDGTFTVSFDNFDFGCQ